MPKFVLTALGVLSLVLVSAQVSAQGILESCSADIDEVCADVTPGDGRILACLYAHSDTISDACFAATDEQARLIERFFDGLADVSAACAGELQEHCADTQAGQGRKFQCLRDLGDQLSAGCSGMLDTIGRR